MKTQVDNLNPRYVACWLAVTRKYFETDLDQLERPILERRRAGWLGGDFRSFRESTRMTPGLIESG